MNNFTHNLKNTFKQVIPKGLVKFYLANIKKVGNPYREYNYKYKTIFIHIPKTAGTSFGRTLFEERDPSVSHTDAFYYQIFEPKLFKEYFKFAIVRNPWDRLYSNYNYFKKNDSFQKTNTIAGKNFVSEYESFTDFLNALENPELVEKMFSIYHFRPQYEFICDYQLNLLIDYLGYFETLNEDFEKIVTRLNRPELKLPYLNPSKKTNNYRDAYTEKGKEIVKKLYPQDIQLFGYSFEGVTNRLVKC